jgi:hypothetical protein
MKAFKAFFLSRLMREKALLLAFVGLGAAIWLSNYANRASSFWREYGRTAETLKMQRKVLASGPAIEAAAKKAIAQLDPAKTLNATSLLATITNLAKDAHLDSGRSEDQNDDPGPQFIMHNLRFSVTKAQWMDLEGFYLKIQQRSPYIVLEQCTVQADRANPNQLSAVFKLRSIEVVR